MIDRNTIDLRDSKLKHIELVKEADKRCIEAMRKVKIWAPETIPSVLFISSSQFKELAALEEEPSSKPTGKEMFKTSNGYVFEIKVEKEDE